MGLEQIDLAILARLPYEQPDRRRPAPARLALVANLAEDETLGLESPAVSGRLRSLAPNLHCTLIEALDGTRGWRLALYGALELGYQERDGTPLFTDSELTVLRALPAPTGANPAQAVATDDLPEGDTIDRLWRRGLIACDPEPRILPPATPAGPWRITRHGLQARVAPDPRAAA